jgi:hypothetical protein
VRPKTVRASGGGIEPALGQHPEAVGMTAGQADGFQIVHPFAPRRHDHRHRMNNGRGWHWHRQWPDHIDARPRGGIPAA